MTPLLLDTTPLLNDFISGPYLSRTFLGDFHHRVG